eukprot:scaffold78709_cov31-Tisochrysis_lutea.AAC.3
MAAAVKQPHPYLSKTWESVALLRKAFATFVTGVTAQFRRHKDDSNMQILRTGTIPRHGTYNKVVCRPACPQPGHATRKGKKAPYPIVRRRGLAAVHDRYGSHYWKRRWWRGGCPYRPPIRWACGIGVVLTIRG